MRVLVLGASGFVGRALVRYLLKRTDAEIIAGVRRVPASDHIDGAVYRTVDATGRESLENAARGASHIIDCVVGPGATMTAKTRLLCELAERSQFTKILHFSSSAVYGAATGHLSEISPVAIDGDWYAAAKISCEKIIAPYAGLNPAHVVLRPSCIYGPGSEQWTARIARLLISHRLGDLGAAGDGECNLVYIDDVCAAVHSALMGKNAVAGRQVFLLNGPSPGTWNDYFAAFARALGAVPLTRLPNWKLRLERLAVGPALKIMAIATKRLRVESGALPDPITPSMFKTFGLNAVYGGELATQQLSIGWTSVDDGLAASVKWFGWAGPSQGSAASNAG